MWLGKDLQELNEPDPYPRSHDPKDPVIDATGPEACSLRPSKERPPYQQRVVTEKAELDDKISRLRPFIGSPTFRGLAGEERVLLEEQLGTMEAYSVILEQRIELF